MKDESILKKLRSLLVMSERGEKYEKEIARERLDLLLKKHNLTISDINPASRITRWFKYRTIFDRRLIVQIVACLFQDKGFDIWKRGTNNREIGFDLSVAEYLEVDRLYSFYKEALEKEIERTYSAFIQVNSLGVDSDDPPQQLTKEEYEELKRMLAMMGAMEKQVPYYQLDRGN